MINAPYSYTVKDKYPIKAVILYDKISDLASEDEMDALLQVKEISQALSKLGFKAYPVVLLLNLDAVIKKIEKINPAFIFNLVDAVDGNGQFLYVSSTLLDHIKLPYTGSCTEALFLTSNKPIAKKMLMQAGIPTPGWLSLKDSPEKEIVFNVPYIIKSVWEHASIGIAENSIIIPENKEQLLCEIKLREEKTGRRCFAELYIEGREFNVSILDGESEPEVLPLAEIVFIDYPVGRWKIVDYKAKWDKGSFEYQNTKRNLEFSVKDKGLINKMSRISIRCWKLFNIHGYARIDFRIDSTGNPWVVDVNANPCLSPDGGFAAAAERAGFSYNRVIERIVGACFQVPKKQNADYY